MALPRTGAQKEARSLEGELGPWIKMEGTFGATSSLWTHTQESNPTNLCISLSITGYLPQPTRSCYDLVVNAKHTEETAAGAHLLVQLTVTSSQACVTSQGSKPSSVKFRVVSLNENFQAGKTQLPAVELQDPEKNLIGQWLNVSLRQGIAELSLPLSSEPQLGEYSVRVKDTVDTFSVEEYVLPKFEVTLNFPKVIVITDEKFTLQVCGS
ncbi:pregnancy zone protein-like [Hyla sarda]|uniref:pregnancy zone protein-like n=1 Tax=Hyla sarda TaxID=327740 RepID=UPI0024C25E7C|nr:pregnancy zone protein-like [Hyla sarda]